jgi:phospholipase/carboxylesterase
LESKEQDDSRMPDSTIEAICQELTRGLEAMGIFQRRFFPPDFANLLEDLHPVNLSLQRARQKLKQMLLAADLNAFHNAIDDAIGLVLDALETVITASKTDFQNAIAQVMRAFRKICRAQERLYQIRMRSPHLNRFFLEPQVHGRVENSDPKTKQGLLTGLHHIGLDDRYYTRGALSIYIPEEYDAARAWPLVIALHGGYGHGRDFIWTWLREARSRGFILLAPTSTETTWSLLDLHADLAALDNMLAFARDKWNIDGDHILLTGISDGATFALLCSLERPSPFTAFAPVAGVLPPLDIGNAKGKRIYWIHGALDWMFPVDNAQRAYEALKGVGADITLRVIDDLSHSYPREENDNILKWFDSRLALPV